jgi:hypothetical protein
LVGTDCDTRLPRTISDTAATSCDSPWCSGTLKSRRPNATQFGQLARAKDNQRNDDQGCISDKEDFVGARRFLLLPDPETSVTGNVTVPI